MSRNPIGERGRTYGMLALRVHCVPDVGRSGEGLRLQRTPVLSTKDLECYKPPSMDTNRRLSNFMGSFGLSPLHRHWA